jgi:hypothetical protein
MTARGVRASWLPWCLWPLAACLSSSPPAPPVRWFDPLLPSESVAGGGVGTLLVTAQARLGSELAVRVGARELQFDSNLRWIAEPRELVATALHRRLVPTGAAARLVVEVEHFEFDLTAVPTAHVRLRLRGEPVGTAVAESRTVARSQEVPELVEAMAQALAEATTQVQRLVEAARRVGS